MARDIRKVVVLGANGAMGAGSGEVFAAAGIPTTFLARTRDKARSGRQRAEKLAKSEALSELISVGSYEEDLERAVGEADLIFEAVSENLDLKRAFFDKIEAARQPGSIVATVSSGLSIAKMCAGRSDDFRTNFLGMHLFNPPNVIVGCEVIPHADTDPELSRFVVDFLDVRLGRQVVLTADTPAFAGNRVGFKVLNEVALLAEEHGVGFIDALIGPHTGRAMPPLTTVDFVGWDVHEAIVDNLHANTNDEAHDAFALPGYMVTLIERGHLGAKTPDKGGFFRTDGDRRLELDPASLEYRPAAKLELPEFVGQMKELHHVGRYSAAMDLFCEAKGDAADLMRKVILGYVSYGLGRVGEVVEAAADIDRIMGFGFNWAPPSVLVDVIGARRAITLMESAGLAVPPVLTECADSGAKLFALPDVDTGKFFIA